MEAKWGPTATNVVKKCTNISANIGSLKTGNEQGRYILQIKRAQENANAICAIYVENV